MGKKGKGKKEPEPPPLSPRVEQSLKILRAEERTSADCSWAAAVIGSKASEGDVSRMDIAAAGAIELLVAVLARPNAEPAELDAAVAALRMITLGNPFAVAYDNASAVVQAGGVKPLVALAQHGSELQKEHAAATLCNVATKQALRTAIAAEGGIPPLLALAKDGTDAQAFHAAFALGSMAFTHADNREAINNADGSIILTKLLTGRSGSPEQRSMVAYALRNLQPPPEPEPGAG